MTAPKLVPHNSTGLVMTLLVRDEESILEDNIWHHYSQGVDVFIVMDNLSTDSTSSILKEISQYIPIDYIYQECDDYNQSEWVTVMARRAFQLHSAKWVINSDADEFWYSPHGRLIDTINQLPDNVGVVDVGRINAVPIRRQGDDPLTACTHPRMSNVFERSSTNSLGQPLPGKCFHRATPSVLVAQGNHSVHGVQGDIVKDARFIIYHYPYQSFPHYSNKIRLGGQAYERSSRQNVNAGITWRRGLADQRKGRLPSIWSDTIAVDQAESELMLLKGKFVEDSSIIKSLVNSDSRRSRIIRHAAFKRLMSDTNQFIKRKNDMLLSRIECFPEADLRHRPLYRNLSFFTSGLKRHRRALERIGEHDSLSLSLDSFRDHSSLAPANRSLRSYARALFETNEPFATRNLAQHILDKNIVLHISCNKNIDLAKESLESFRVAGCELVNIIVVGNGSHDTSESSGWNLSYEDGILSIPVPDTYEMLHRKVFHTLFLLSCLGGVRTVTKIDDNLRLASETAFSEQLNRSYNNRVPCIGRVVGSERHGDQLHGWHIGKCANTDLHERGYSYPLPRRYPAGGYGYVLNIDGIEACADMYSSMKEFFSISAVGLEDAFVGHALNSADLHMSDVWSEEHLLALPGLLSLD